MTSRPRPSPDGFGSVRADEILPAREVARRLGFGVRTLRECYRQGLKRTRIGKSDYVVGADVIEFIRAMNEKRGPYD